MASFTPTLPAYIENPYPALHRLRAEEPVHRSDDLEAWVITSYAACVEVLRDHEAFSSDLSRGAGRLARQVQQQRQHAVLGGATHMVGSDPPEHTRLRGLVTRAFTPRYAERMREFVEREVDALLAAATPDAPFDLVDGLCEPLPAAVIAEHLCAGCDDRKRVLGWAYALMRTASLIHSPEGARAEAERAREELLAYLETTARRPGGGSLIAQMAGVAEDGESPTSEELLELTIDLAVAGNDTTASMIGNGVMALMAHPDQQALLRRRPNLLPGAIEEMLRYDAPTQALVRVATREVTLRGQRIAPGDTLLLMLGAANRDPAQFPEPDRFDITRTENRHLSFGMGIHFCAGAPLARIEGEVALRAILRRFPRLRLAPGATLPRSDDWMLRSARRIPLDTSDMAGGTGETGTAAISR